MGCDKGLCPSCVNFISHFNICLDTPILTFDLEEPPEEHICARQYLKADSPKRYKQMSLPMVEMSKKTFFEFEFDNDGWIQDVHVKGMPRIPLDGKIPHELVMFSFYNVPKTSAFSYSGVINPNAPCILLCSGLIDQTPTILKSWNDCDRHVPVLMVYPALRMLADVISLLEGHNPSSNSPIVYEFLSRDNFEDLVKLWITAGYQGGFYKHPDGYTIPYIAYRLGENGERSNTFIFPKGLYPFVYEDVIKNIQIQATGDNHLLEKLDLDKHCVLCGYEYDEITITQPCAFCHRNSSPVVFK